MSILIVDDDMVVSRALSRALESLGYESRRVCSFQEALHALATERPSLLLVDFDLSDSSTGVDLAVWARTAYRLPVVMMTGHAPDWVRADLAHAGMDEVQVLAKPFPLAELGAAVARHVPVPDSDPWDVFERGGRRHVT
jgi:DNA-binding response OmpR family regulator